MEGDEHQDQEDSVPRRTLTAKRLLERYTAKLANVRCGSGFSCKGTMLTVSHAHMDHASTTARVPMV